MSSDRFQKIRQRMNLIFSAMQCMKVVCGRTHIGEIEMKAIREYCRMIHAYASDMLEIADSEYREVHDEKRNESA